MTRFINYAQSAAATVALALLLIGLLFTCSPANAASVSGHKKAVPEYRRAEAAYCKAYLWNPDNGLTPDGIADPGRHSEYSRTRAVCRRYFHEANHCFDRLPNESEKAREKACKRARRIEDSELERARLRVLHPERE